MSDHLFKFYTVILLATALIVPSTGLSSSDIDSKNLKYQIDIKMLNKFQKTVSAIPQPMKKKPENPVRIAVIYPSADISDFWIRNFTAMTKRLEALKLPFEVEEFSSKQIEHSLQTQYTEAVLNSDIPYDFVIFGPSELNLQSKNIQKLAESDSFSTFIWAFHTPNPEWKYQPDAWFDFSSSMGAEVLCDFVILHLGSDIAFSTNRGIPGITDTQRSQGFIDCVDKKGNWRNVYEHFGQYQKLGGADGVRLVLENFPEVSMIHNANTAMTIGAIDALQESNRQENIFVTGWGGTAKEIEKLKRKELSATPMRMNDDLGVATAEAIKFYVEQRKNEVPLIYLGRITVAHSGMSDDVLNTLTREAFRYSGQ